MHRQPHILIVDDDGFIRDSIDYIAKQLGYKTSLAKNGREALEFAQNEIFDLIISDLYMPIMDGNELIVSIKEMPEYKNIPFLFLSGSSERKTWIKNLKAGADDFIIKPYDKKLLALKLRSHIKKHFLRKELFKSNMEYNINLKEGMIVYCTTKENPFNIQPNKLIAEIKPIFNSKELFEVINKLNIWLLILDSNALNEFSVSKINSISNQVFSIVLISDDLKNIQPEISNGIGNFILKSTPEELFYHQINSFIKREIEIKSKYINAIKLAVDSSPIRFESKTEQIFDNLTISVIHEPYRYIPGGDFYEIITSPKKDIKVIILGDVMGKKWGAWFFVNAYLAYIRSAIHFLLEVTPSAEMTASGIIEHLNKIISHDMQIGEVFTTLSVILMKKGQPLNIAAAGAMKPLFYKFSDKTISLLNITGMLLGISKDSTYNQLEIKLESSDKILFYTDGYTETLNNKTNEMLSVDSLIEILQRFGENPTMNLQDFESAYIEKNNIISFDDDRSLLLISSE